MTTPQMPGNPADTPWAGDQLTEEQRAFLLARQAQQAVASPSPAADARTAAAAMAAAERGPELPAESEMDKLMAAFKAQSDQLASLMQRVDVLQKMATERDAELGGPPVVRYAQGAADKIEALVAAHPDLGKDHFAAPRAAAKTLVDVATELATNGGPSAPVESKVAELERWIGRTHWRTGRKFIDFSAIADDLATAVEEAIKLAA